MSQPTATLDDYTIRSTLITWIQKVFPLNNRIEYRLVGSASAVVRGAACPAKDIDILVRNHSDVDQFGAALSAFKCLQAPTWLPEARQYYANYLIDGVEVGFSTVDIDTDSDLIETYGPGPWKHFTVVICGYYRVPTADLELQLITQLLRERPDYYNPIIASLQRRGADLDLVSRGLIHIGLPQTRQDEILKQLQTA
jgi:hypothetical protein